MPRLSQSVPKYRKHKASAQAFVELNGRRFYLGPHGTKVSRVEYDRLISEWLQNGRTRKTANSDSGGLLVVELIAAYLHFAKIYYRKAGRLTSEYAAILHAVRDLKLIYGRKTVSEFGPIALQTVITRMVANGWSRRTINRQAGRIKRMFRWGVSQEIVPAMIYNALATVSGLRHGRSAARETDPILPVADQAVEATLGHLSEVAADMVRFQRLTGCRPDEVCAIRPSELDRSQDVWQYRPQSHKTEHHSRERVILIGPRAQVVLLKYLTRDSQMYCFRPVDSEARRRAAAHAARSTPLSQGNRPGTNRKARSQRPPGERYSVDAYRRAITRGCDKAFPHPTLSEIPKTKLSPEQLVELNKWYSAHRWSPNQLRHSAATEIRRQFGLEAAQILLGHSQADVTQIYAERDLAKGIEISRRIG